MFGHPVARRLRSHDVIDTLADAMVTHGSPEHVSSDNGRNSWQGSEEVVGWILDRTRGLKILIDIA